MLCTASEVCYCIFFPLGRTILHFCQYLELKWQDDWRMMNRKGFGRKQSQPYLGIILTFVWGDWVNLWKTSFRIVSASRPRLEPNTSWIQDQSITTTLLFLALKYWKGIYFILIIIAPYVLLVRISTSENIHCWVERELNMCYV
jgi:hypothetical protein